MRRFGLLMLLAVVGLFPMGCGSKSSPTSASSGSSSSGAFTYPYFQNIGSYMYTEVTNAACSINSNPVLDPVPGGFFEITGVAVGGGYLFAADDDAGDIQVFDTNGNFVTWFWPFTSNGNQNVSPEGMKVANNRLYVADLSNTCVDAYNISDIINETAQTLTCNQVFAFATYFNNASACQVYDVDLDSKGNMYVADACAGTNNTGLISVIAPDLNFSTASSGGPGAGSGNGTGGYNQGDDVLFSTSTGSSGVTNGNGGNLVNPYGIAVDPNGKHVYVSDNGNNVVQIYDGTLTSVGFIGNSAGNASTMAGQFDYPWGVRLDNQGNLMVADNDNSRVQRLTTGGSVLNIIGASDAVNGQLYSPAYLAVDPANNLYVTDNNIGTIDVYAAQ